jgi:endogenous inhibitor of DNA gyrase (YacG/DUF329 family)
MDANTPDTPPQNAPRAGRPCPICGKEALAAFRPFCSKRCADVDLHRWLGGVYAVRDDDRSRGSIGDHDVEDSSEDTSGI